MNWKRDDKGFMLIGVLVVSIGLFTIVSGITYFGLNTNKRTVSEAFRAQAFYAAEAGVNHALAMLRAGADLPLSEPPKDGLVPEDEPPIVSAPGTKPVYKVWLYIDPVDGQLRIASQGEEGTIIRHAMVNVVEGGEGGSAPQVGDGGVVPISWPSCACSITGPSQGSLGIGYWPNYSPYTISAPSIYSDINVAASGVLNLINAGELKVTGTHQLNANTRMIVQSAGNMTICANRLQLNSNSFIDADVTGDFSVCTSEFHLNANTYVDLNVDGKAIFHTTQSNINSNSRLRLSANTALLFWHEGWLELNSNFHTDDFGSSSQDQSLWPRIVVQRGLQLNANVQLGNIGSRPVLIFMDPEYTDPIELNSNAKIYGLLWAPTRTVTLNSNAFIYGKVIAKKIILNANAHIHGEVIAEEVMIHNTSNSGIYPGIYYNFDNVTIPGATSGTGFGIGFFQAK